MTKNNFFRALDGHPSIFMKILHYAVFYASGSVRNFLYSKEIDPMTIHLNDFKFMEKIMFIFVSSIFSLNEILDEYYGSQAKNQHLTILQIRIRRIKNDDVRGYHLSSEIDGKRNQN
jgi:hypothetical protein